MKFYAGIGSRQTPKDVLDLMTRLAKCLAREGWTLRSGGAEGADTAFQNGARGEGPSFIYRPHHATPAAMELAAKFHPAWERCSEYAQKLHARNGFQVLGPRLDQPSKFVVCWTPGASGSGGTGQAIRVAKAYGIDVYDLADPTVRRRIETWVDEMEAA